MLTLTRTSNPFFTGHRDGLVQFMNEIFDDFDTTSNDSISPPVDIREHEDRMTILVDLPGIDRDSIDVSVENRSLTISAERKRETLSETETEHRVERSFGRFTRQFTLPTTLDSEKISAEYKDGVLSVDIAKGVEAKPRRIEVKAS